MLDTKCEACKGAGAVWADLRSFGFGEGFGRFMAAGAEVLRGDDGSVRHQIVCPACDGTGETPPAGD